MTHSRSKATELAECPDCRGKGCWVCRLGMVAAPANDDGIDAALAQSRIHGEQLAEAMARAERTRIRTAARSLSTRQVPRSMWPEDVLAWQRRRDAERQKRASFSLNGAVGETAKALAREAGLPLSRYIEALIRREAGQ